jgi:hypothetical protein
MEKNKSDQLLDKYPAGNCTSEENLYVEKWLDILKHDTGRCFNLCRGQGYLYSARLLNLEFLSDYKSKSLTG